jgi:ABC-type Fe3+ transport system substrate-binding protein
MGALSQARRQAKRVALAGMVALGLCGSAGAQSVVSTTAEMAAYAGADRTDKLIAGAKKEGVVTLYTSANVDDMAVVTAAFEKKYDVKVRVWRGSSETLVQRSVAEARGNRVDADVFETGGAAMESLHREKLLQEIKSPVLADLDQMALRPHREWTGTRYNVFVGAYNTRLIRKEELPKGYADLVDPKWKGKLGIEADDSDWFGGVIDQIGEERGLKLFRDIATTNGISVRKGHTLLANLITSGEVPLALTAYAYRVIQLKNSGAPVDWFTVPPTIARLEGIGVARRAAHPNAAILFYDFMLTEAQELLNARDYFPMSRKVRPLVELPPLTFLDPARVLDNNQKWGKYYRDTFISRTR